ncbi:MAG TPA: DUF4142 domain-containing protein [Tepidisphaeraceae bacterium]|nr:DUF4142 domain-containing protein [Tepidisphaeraceae bacterium]
MLRHALKVTAASAALYAGCLLGGCGTAAEGRAAAGDPESLFLASTAHSSTSELTLSQMALERASDPRVRQYAQMMVTDHTKQNAELARLAQAKGMDVPARPDEAHAKTAATLRQLSGQRFDREYMSEMVADHAKLLSKMQDKAASATDPEIRAWAAAQVPILRSHLDHARQINQAIGGASSLTAGPSTGAAMPAGGHHSLDR